MDTSEFVAGVNKFIDVDNNDAHENCTPNGSNSNYSWSYYCDDKNVVADQF